MAVQLDNQRIAVRERSLPEIMDLALHVIRAVGMPLLIAFALGAAPMLLINYLLLGTLFEADFYDGQQAFDYLSMMGLMVLVEVPLFAAPATLLLGQWMFRDAVNLREMASDFLRSLPQIFLFQGVLRGGLLFCSCLLVPLALPYVGWPYLNEIILLERNPLLARGTGTVTTLQRAWRFHKDNIPVLLVRWLGSMAVGMLLLIAVSLSLWIGLSALSAHWHGYSTYLVVYLPVSVWIVMGFFTVVRFLAYLDLRIRREGWELELAMRAEATRLRSRMA